MPILYRALIAAFLTFQIQSAFATETVVPLSGKYALLNQPKGTAKAGVILFTGGNGFVGIKENGFVKAKKNWIVWTRAEYAKSGIASLLVDGGTDVFDAISLLKNKGINQVYLVGMSRGCHRAFDGISGGITGIVFVSCRMDEIRNRLGDPGKLPKALVIHNRQDGCKGTAPYKTEEFGEWAGKKAQIKWMTGSYITGDLDPCGAQGHHGHKGIEMQVVAEIVRFVSR